MRLSIVTISYNSSENTIKLLESLKSQTDKNFEVIVVDNNSDDIGKLMDYKTSETNITYIKNDSNLGFSGGNNVGIKKALENGALREASGQASWVLLLNNDTWVESSFIEHLKANLGPSAGSGQEGREGIVGLALDEGDRIAYAGQIQWLKPTLKHVYGIEYPVSGMNTKYKIQNTRYYAIGGAMLIHKSVFDKIGLLDENYFLYFEDADFCQKARKAGIPISFISNIKIAHSVSTSTKKLGSPLLLRYHYRNALYFNLKNGPWYIKLLVWPWSWIILVKQLIKIAIQQNVKESKGVLAGVTDFYKNSMGKIKTGIKSGK